MHASVQSRQHCESLALHEASARGKAESIGLGTREGSRISCSSIKDETELSEGWLVTA